MRLNENWGKKQGKGKRIEIGRTIKTTITKIHKDVFHCHQHSTHYLSEATSGEWFHLRTEPGSFHVNVGDIAHVKTTVKNLYFRIRTILYVWSIGY